MMRWAALLIVSAAVTAAMNFFDIPAALLLGPLLTGIAAALAGVEMRIKPAVAIGSQGMIGCMVAAMITAKVGQVLAAHGLALVLIAILSLATSLTLGWASSRSGAMPGTSAIWAFSPGAAPVMVTMALEAGDDARIVAFMQYLRILLVALIAISSTHFLAGDIAAPPARHWLDLPEAWGIFEAITVAGVGAWIGYKSHFPGGAFLVPALGGGLLQATGVISLELPLPLLALSYAAIGWQIGLSFTLQAIRHCARILPVALAGLLILIAAAAGFALAASWLLEIDRISTFLATCPGGLDTVLIISASVRADMDFVLTAQLARFFVTIVVAPPVAKLIADRIAVQGD